MRDSYINRIFTSIVDYNVSAFEKVVIPTVQTFAHIKDTKSYKDLQRDNNNVSHSERFGAIQLTGSHFELTPVGKRLFLDPSLFGGGMFIEQALAFSLHHAGQYLFPYRALLKMMCELDYINQFEFVVAPYLLTSTSEHDIKNALDRIQILRHRYGTVKGISDTQKITILADVNLNFGLSLTFEDVWSSDTTAYNQFRYFGNHLSHLVDGIQQQLGEIVKGSTSTNAEIKTLLSATASVESLSGIPSDLKTYYRS